MNCNQIRELLPELILGAGIEAATPEIAGHIAACNNCASALREFQKTMALLDQWQAPEPSPYFDTRLQARLREEMAKPQAGWLHWFRRPVLAAALTVLLGVGVGLFFTRNSGIINHGQAAFITGPPG